MRETNLQPTQYPRTVVLDIETVSLDPNLAKGALDALTGRECVRRTGESGCGGKEQTACRQRGAPNKRHRGDLPDQRELLPNAADNYLEYA